MCSLILTTSRVDSKRWLDALPDASVFVADNDNAIDMTENALVWLVLDGSWRNHLDRALSLGAKVVALTLNENAREARELVGLGASGYLHAFAAPEQLQQVRKAVEYDGLWLGRDLMRELLSTPKPSVAGLDQLSARELAVAEAVAAGNSNKEVASLLDITERTVKAHLSACFDKLDVRDRMQLALLLGRRDSA